MASAPASSKISSLLESIAAPFQAPPERALALGEDFHYGFAASWVYCAVVGGLSCLFAERVFGSAFASISSSKKAMWHCYTYCLFGGVISCWLMSADIRPLFVDNVFDPHYQYYAKHTASFRRAAGFSCGFLAFDLTVLIVCHRVLIEAYKRPMYMQMMVHHVLSIASWPLTISHSLAMGFVAYCILTESTSVFVNLHWFIREAKVDGTRLGVLNGALLFVSYFLVRILPIPWVAWCWWSCAKSDWTWIEWLYGAITVPLPSCFNLFWFSIILKGVRAKLTGGRRATSGTGDKKSE